MEKALAHGEVVARARAFAADYDGERYEKGESQSFWTALLHVFGVDRRRVGAAFEQPATRASTNSRGFIDLFWPGVLLAEQKSAGKDLDSAKAQAFDYLPSLPDVQLPKAVIVSDFKRLRIWRLDRGDSSTSIDFDLRDLPENVDHFGFLTDSRDAVIEAEEAVNEKAVARMRDLYMALVRAKYSDHFINVFLMRVLFLLFGDDTGLWPRNLFRDFVTQRTSPDGTDVGPQLVHLFQTLDKPVENRASNLDDLLARFPYVNGGLFAERIDIPAFDSDMRAALLAACDFEWDKVSPAIFGSMFQAVKDKVARREGGEHYTTEANILKTLRPLFLDELTEELDACGVNLAKLDRFHKKLGRIRVIDPACGCGNFLMVAYRELRMLELDLLRRRLQVTGQGVLGYDVTASLLVSPDHFYGIEIEEWPARIAETAFFLIDHQINRLMAQEFGEAPERLPIKVTAQITRANALHLNWRDLVQPGPEVVVVGNPLSSASTPSPLNSGPI